MSSTSSTITPKKYVAQNEKDGRDMNTDSYDTTDLEEQQPPSAPPPLTPRQQQLDRQASIKGSEDENLLDLEVFRRRVSTLKGWVKEMLEEVQEEQWTPGADAEERQMKE